ncbi:MAG: hypothetical protein ACR2L2_07900 [Acidobacteriota bacterium]
MRNLLVIQTAPLPALVFTLDQLRRHFPYARITVFCRAETATLAAVAPRADDVIGRHPGESLRASRRKLSRQAFDACVVVQPDSAPYWRAKWMAWLLGIRPVVTMDADTALRRLSWEGFLHFTHGSASETPAAYRSFEETFVEPGTEARVLVVETCDRSDWALRAPVIARLFPRARLTLVTPRTETPPVEVAEQILLSRRDQLPSAGASGPWDGVVVFFTGAPGYARWKRLALSLPTWRTVVVNENNDFFHASLRSLAGFAWQRLRFGVRRDIAPRRFAKQLVLLVQTDDAATIQTAAQKLLDGNIAGADPTVDILCSASSSATFQPVAFPPKVDLVRTYPAKPSWAAARRLLAELRRERYDVAAVVLSGKPTFRKLKLLPWLVGARHRLIFNENLDCFYSSPARLGRLLLRRLRHGSDIPAPIAETIERAQPRRYALRPRLLVVQTSADDQVDEILSRLADETLFAAPRVDVLCRQDKRAHFTGSPLVAATHTYALQHRLGDFRKLLRQMRHERYDVVVIHLTGVSAYSNLKALAFLLGGKQILLFNEHLDCFYFSPRLFLRFLTARRVEHFDRPRFHWELWLYPLSQISKLVTFPFRFLYLVMQVTTVQWTRGYTRRRD